MKLTNLALGLSLSLGLLTACGETVDHTVAGNAAFDVNVQDNFAQCQVTTRLDTVTGFTTLFVRRNGGIQDATNDVFLYNPAVDYSALAGTTWVSLPTVQALNTPLTPEQTLIFAE